MSDGNNVTDSSPKKKRRRKWHLKSNSQPLRPDSPPIQPHRIRLSQQNYAAISSDSSEGVRFGRLRRSCGLLSGEDDLTNPDDNITEVQEPERENNCPKYETNQHTENEKTPINNDSADTINSVEIPNAQAEKYNEVPQTQSSNPEMEDTYVDYRVTHVQGGGDREEPQRSIDGAYSLVANSLKLSTV